LPPSPLPLSSAKAVEYNDRILSEICSDSDPDEDGQFSAAAGFNATALSTKEAAATEKYSEFWGNVLRRYFLVASASSAYLRELINRRSLGCRR
jgi:hypothetical protein